MLSRSLSLSLFLLSRSFLLYPLLSFSFEYLALSRLQFSLSLSLSHSLFIYSFLPVSSHVISYLASSLANSYILLRNLLLYGRLLLSGVTASFLASHTRDPDPMYCGMKTLYTSSLDGQSKLFNHVLPTVPISPLSQTE